MKILKAAVVVAVVLIFAATVNAKEGLGAQQELEAQMDSYELEKYDLAVRNAIGSIEGFEDRSFGETVYEILTGDESASFSNILKSIVQKLFLEIYDNLAIMRNIILIAVVGAVFKSMSSEYFSESVGELGNMVIYIILISLITVSFVEASEIATGAIGRMSSFMKALIPLIMGLLVASGRYAVSFVFHPAVILVIQLATQFIQTVVLGLIVCAGCLQTVNFLLPEGTLDKMTKLVGKAIEKGLKWLAIAFMAVMSLKTLAVPIADGIAGKGLKLAMSTVPVVGQMFSGAVDSVFYWAGALKNSVAIAAVIFVGLLCFIPVIKLAAISIIYRLTAALIEPMVNERFSDCISAAGKYVALFIGAVMCVAVMFIVLLMMVIAGAIG